MIASLWHRTLVDSIKVGLYKSETNSTQVTLPPHWTNCHNKILANPFLFFLPKRCQRKFYFVCILSGDEKRISFKHKDLCVQSGLPFKSHATSNCFGGKTVLCIWRHGKSSMNCYDQKPATTIFKSYIFESIPEVEKLSFPFLKTGILLHSAALYFSLNKSYFQFEYILTHDDVTATTPVKILHFNCKIRIYIYFICDQSLGVMSPTIKVRRFSWKIQIYTNQNRSVTKGYVRYMDCRGETWLSHSL